MFRVIYDVIILLICDFGLGEKVTEYIDIIFFFEGVIIVFYKEIGAWIHPELHSALTL